MHPVNGLQLDEWAKERYAYSLSEAQQELRARAVGRQQSRKLWQWFRMYWRGWHRSLQAKVRYRTGAMNLVHHKR